MLVQKGLMEKRTKILLIILGAMVIGGGIFAYFSFFYTPKIKDSTPVKVMPVRV